MRLTVVCSPPEVKLTHVVQGPPSPTLNHSVTQTIRVARGPRYTETLLSGRAYQGPRGDLPGARGKGQIFGGTGLALYCRGPSDCGSADRRGDREGDPGEGGHPLCCAQGHGMSEGWRPGVGGGAGPQQNWPFFVSSRFAGASVPRARPGCLGLDSGWVGSAVRATLG